MGYLLMFAYKLGELSTKTPKLSTKPVKEFYKSFKQGRSDSKGAKVYTDISL